MSHYREMAECKRAFSAPGQRGAGALFLALCRLKRRGSTSLGNIEIIEFSRFFSCHAVSRFDYCKMKLPLQLQLRAIPR